MKPDNVLYLGIDFVLKSRKSLDRLVDELKAHVVCDKSWRGTKLVVIKAPSRIKKLEAEINHLCALIENLSPAAKRCWNQCFLRTIDVGFESGKVPRGKQPAPLEMTIDPLTLNRAAEISATLQLTVYPRTD